MSTLTCGCCGCWFEGEQTFEQDTGYGTCSGCDDWIEETFTKPHMDKSIELIQGALRPENAAKFKALPRDRQEAFALSAHDDGLFKWTIGGQS